ncbi:hypothetical protein [Desertivirga brevis]|uniref:hypothetical protein n=1 Tax=Desertivirga brevis TaxID=2810310 RepID=UPI001A976F5D|nr:hypothetical protein [Pedobacter sp. SYSU D00873]
MTKLYLLLLLIVVLQVRCKEEESETITIVTGRIYDPILGKPIGGKVALWAYKSNGDWYKSSSYPYKKLDSVRTTVD